MDESSLFEKLLRDQNDLINLQHQHWIQYELPSVQFWLLLAMLIIPWIVWWKLVDKKRLPEIFIYGLIIQTIVTFLDETGCQLNLWEYRYDLEPLFPRLIPMNFSMLPVAYMLIYSYFPRWKAFIIASIVMGLLFTFVGEPLFAALKIYVLIIWKHIYSLPIYILIAIAVKALTSKIMQSHRQALE